MKDKERLIIELFDVSTQIRYIAVNDCDGLVMKQRSDLNNVSSSESDKYEELLVNCRVLQRYQRF